MKNFIQKLKEKMNKAENKALAVIGGAAAGTGVGYCKNVNQMGQQVMSLIFNGIMYVGIALTAVGIIQLVRCIMAVSGGDQLQPGQLGKAVGFTIGGIVCIGLKVLITSITGVNPDNVTLT